MIQHIALFRWKRDASAEAIDKAMAELVMLKEKIPGIVELSSGVSFSERSRGYTHALVGRFINRAALDAHFPHPEHQRVLEHFINGIRLESIVFDYEV
ncbi:MAG: Dabb family protein [Verrucomicrobiota bacterium]|jgi:hypothetical protein